MAYPRMPRPGGTLPREVEGWKRILARRMGTAMSAHAHTQAVLKIDPMAQKVSTIGEPIDSGPFAGLAQKIRLLRT